MAYCDFSNKAGQCHIIWQFREHNFSYLRHNTGTPVAAQTANAGDIIGVWRNRLAAWAEF